MFTTLEHCIIIIYAKAGASQFFNSSNDVTENIAICPLIYWIWKIPLINLASEALQYSRKYKQVKFSKYLSGVHVTRGFGTLKGFWRCFLKRLNSEIENVSNVIIACVVLHNTVQLNWVKNGGEPVFFVVFNCSFISVFRILHFIFTLLNIVWYLKSVQLF